MAVADGGEVQAEHVEAPQDGRIGVVRQGLVHREHVGAAPRVGGPCPGVERGAAAGPGFEERHRITRANGFEVQIRAQPRTDVGVLYERACAHEAVLLAVGEDDHQTVAGRLACRQHARGFEGHRHAEGIVACARTGGDAVVVRHERHGLALLPVADGDHVGDAGGTAAFTPLRLGLLYADVEAVQLKRLDQVGARFLIGGGPRRATANRPRQPLDVRPGILRVEPAASEPASAGQQQQDEKHRAPRQQSPPRPRPARVPEGLPHAR